MTKPLVSATPEGESLVTITASEYARLTARAQDIADAARAAEGRSGPALPADLARRVLAGDLHPLVAWRKAAGLTQAQLAERSGQRSATISDIEAGKVDPRLSTVKALAEALDLDIDDLVP
ncbi:helix-turn-helix transcriptional regulator [Rhodobium gokarnense]|uniref:DNA-binding XRE family transcriptional regulator n=1 Tax=Rhodobium gokarnense TaxID=364296 RepID=A0ABT3H7N6_9HYPH|nr:helix-turn-helix transcriptional regulator [Rhodobium gokarnense]MCW2306394.1 DNA-binding XRE family transcriptional regulator [Rhodobium gokarnense]